MCKKFYCFAVELLYFCFKNFLVAGETFRKFVFVRFWLEIDTLVVAFTLPVSHVEHKLFVMIAASCNDIHIRLGAVTWQSGGRNFAWQKRR